MMKVRVMALLTMALGLLVASPHAAEKRALPALPLVDVQGQAVATAACRLSRSGCSST